MMPRKLLQKLDLGMFWPQFGRGLGRSGPSFSHFWVHFRHFLDVPNHIFSKHWSKMNSKRHFGWILDRFWKVLVRFWEGSGRNLGGFGVLWGGCDQILEAFGTHMYA